MGLLLGAKDLGLSVAWRFGFVPAGTRADTTPGVLFLDVGGQVCPGVLDHHGGGSGAECAAELVGRRSEHVYTHLLGPRLAQGTLCAEPAVAWSPTIITHEAPDFDSVSAALLAIRIVEDGGLPPWADALMAYSREVDQGRGAFSPKDGDPIYPVHLAYLAIQNIQRDGRPVPYADQMRRGLALLERTMEQVSAARRASGLPRATSAADFQPPNPGAGDWRFDETNRDIVELLAGERERFERDRAPGAFKEETCCLPRLDGVGSVGVKAFISQRPPESVLNKYWVRSEGYPFFICPYGTPTVRDGKLVYPRVVLSLDPTWCDGQNRYPSLEGLGYTLERKESAARRAQHQGVDDRGGPPRYGDGYSQSRDPWYDGRAHRFGIVDAPIGGTILPYDDVTTCATAEKFWAVPLASAEVTLAWPGALTQDPPPGGDGLGRCAGMAETLDALYRNSHETAAEPCRVEVPRDFDVRATTRVFPPGTCGPMRVVTITAKEDATLEGLVELRQKVVAAEAGSPAYTMGRVNAGAYFGTASRLDALIRQLADADLQPLTTPGDSREVVLFNSRTLLFGARQADASPAPSPADLEVLLYVAFLNESLVQFSARVSTAVERYGTEGRLDTGTIRQDFLRFQTAYFQTDICRYPRGRLLADSLLRSMSLFEHYAEVQSELDRLAQLEATIESQRQARADDVMQFVLYLVALAGVLQTFVAFYVLPNADLESPALRQAVGGIIVTAVAVYAAVFAWRRKR